MVRAYHGAGVAVEKTAAVAWAGKAKRDPHDCAPRPPTPRLQRTGPPESGGEREEARGSAPFVPQGRQDDGERRKTANKRKTPAGCQRYNGKR
jgi:hypothetical protein